MNLPRFFTMAATIMDIPADIVPAFVGDPTCQLRYTCTRFRREIDQYPFVAAPEMITSAWYSVRIPDRTRDCIRDSRNMDKVPSWDAIIAAQASFLILRSDRTWPTGLLLWDRSTLPYLAAAREFKLYKYIQRIDEPGTGGNVRRDVPGERYAIIGICVAGYLTRVADVPAKPAASSYYGTALVYERMTFADFAVQN